MEDPVATCQKWLTICIQLHVAARGDFTINLLLSALFAAKSYGHGSRISNTIIIKVMVFSF